MNHYFTAEAPTPGDVIFAYRGNDDKNSLSGPVPRDLDAAGSRQLPATMSTSAAEADLAQSFAPLAVANPGHRILIRLSAENVITYWLTPRDA